MKDIRFCNNLFINISLTCQASCRNSHFVEHDKKIALFDLLLNELKQERIYL